MTATIASPMFLQFFNPDNSGAPAVGYLLFTYEAGTSTPQATWTDSSQDTENPNPLTLDSQGRAFVWGDPTLAYKLVLAPPNSPNPPTSITASVDNYQFPIPQAFTQSAIGQLLWPQSAAEAAAGVTPSNYAYAPGNVCRYGADPTGVADSTSAFQQALNSVSYIVSPTTLAECLAQGGEVYIPRGFYKIISTLYLNSNVHLVGEDCGPIQQTSITESGTPSCAMILYSGAAASIAIDASGFWLVSQTGYTGTASAGAASTITISTGLTINTGCATITITGGPGAGQTRGISAYNSGSGVTTVSWPWVTQPTNASTWSIAAVTVGSRMSRILSQSEEGLESQGIGSYSQGVAVKNLAIIASANQYMGLRYNVAPQGVGENLLIVGFQVGMEATGCAYPIFRNILTQATLIGFAWIQGDHLTRINCMEFGVAATSQPLTTANRPWFVDYQAQEGLDPNPSYWTAHYAFQEIGVYISCDGEGGDRSYYNQGSPNSLYLGCHMERMNELGMWFSNSNGAWMGGDYFPSNVTPVFSGIACNFTIESSSVSYSNYDASATTIGSFPNTYGGRVTIRNTPPLSADVAPSAGSLVVWDAFAQPGAGNANASADTFISTVGNGALSAAAIAGGIIVRTGPTAAFTDTTDTAANIIAQFIPGAVVGKSLQLCYLNNSSFAATLAGGSGVTIYLVGGTVPATTTRRLIVLVTDISSPAVTIIG